METVSADYTLKPSLPRIFLGDLLIFLFAYSMVLVSRSNDASSWFVGHTSGKGLILLAGVLGCLLVGALECEKMSVRLVDGRLEGLAPFSWKPVGFPLAALDWDKTRESLNAKTGLLKRSYLWSVDGERIELRRKAFEPGEFEAFLKILNL
jgi:hypothetical protein